MKNTHIIAVMPDKEKQAHDLVRNRNWSRAVALYDEIMAATPSYLSRAQKDRHIICLLGRCECLFELGKYEACLADASKVLALISEQPADCLTSVSRTRKWQIHSLCKLKKYMVS